MKKAPGRSAPHPPHTPLTKGTCPRAVGRDVRAAQGSAVMRSFHKLQPPLSPGLSKGRQKSAGKPPPRHLRGEPTPRPVPVGAFYLLDGTTRVGHGAKTEHVPLQRGTPLIPPSALYRADAPSEQMLRVQAKVPRPLGRMLEYSRYRVRFAFPDPATHFARKGVARVYSDR